MGRGHSDRAPVGRTRITLAVLIGGATIIVPAHAQEASAADLGRRSGAERIDSNVGDIVVTAQRREQRLQDVPVAVTAVSQDALRDIQATNIGDLQGVVPNLTLHDGDASNAVVYIRGVGQIDSLSFADPGVGIYLDDVYLGRAQGAFLTVYDVDRVEVLRGPQGTLYGRNTIGGAVKFVSSALSNDPTYRAELTLGSYDDVELSGAIGGALIEDSLLAKAAVSFIRRDGFSDNAFDGRDDGDKRQFAGRVAMEYRAGSDFRLRLNVDGSRDRPDTSRTPARATSVFGLYPPTTNDPFQVDANFNQLSDLDTFGVSLTADWNIGSSISLKSISAYRRMVYKANLDTDATPLDLFGVYVDQHQHQLSQEVQVTYTGDRLNAVAGLFYFDEKDRTLSGLFAPALGLVTAGTNRQHNRSAAAYGQLSYEFVDRLSLIAGLRYTSEHKDFARTQELFPPTTSLPVPLGTGLLVTDLTMEKSWNSFSPKVGLDYRPSDDVLLYASISRGFKSGGFDGRADTPERAKPYDPETLWAYEIGVKSTLLDRRLTANLALFYNDYTNLQLSSFTAAADGSFSALFTNAGAATIRGAEFELAARPVPGLAINFQLGYLDAQYDRYIGPGGNDISRLRKLVNAPEWSGRLGVKYRIDLGDRGGLSIGGDASYRSKTYPTVSSSEILAQPGYILVDAFVRWASAKERYYVQVGGKNLTNKRYRTHGFDLSDSLGYQLAYYGDPRVFRVTFGTRF